MKTRIFRVSLLAAAMAVLPLVGCKSSGESNHEKWVNQADTRYRNLRTGLILEMAQQHFDAGDLENAQASVEDALEIDPTSAPLLTLAGRIQLERGKLERAFHLFSLAIENDDKIAQAYYLRGLVLQRWKRFDGAKTDYDKAYDLESDNPAYLLANAEMYVEIKKPHLAIDLLESKRDYFEQSAGLRITLGQLYLLTDQPLEAAACLREAAVLAPDELSIQEELAIAQAAAGEHGQAIRTLRSLLREPGYENRSDIQRALADAYQSVNDHDAAKKIYLELTRKDQNPQDWFSLAEIAFAKEDWSGVHYAIGKTIQLDPSRHDAYMLRGMAWQRQGNIEQALHMFDRAAELAPSESVPLIMRGITLQRAGKQAAAAEAYRQALQRQPNDHRAQRLLASVAEVQTQ